MTCSEATRYHGYENSSVFTSVYEASPENKSEDNLSKGRAISKTEMHGTPTWSNRPVPHTNVTTFWKSEFEGKGQGRDQTFQT